MRAFFPYPGSKAILARQIVALLPYHKHYVSVFGGSGADILFKPKSPLETFNDCDGLIYNLFSITLNGQADALRQRILNTHPCSKRVYDEALTIVKRPITDPVLSAWAFLVVAYQGFSLRHPALMDPGNWQHICRAHPTGLAWLNLPDTFDLVRRRMQHVQLDNRDWAQVIDSYDSVDTCFYLDPPYSPDAVPWKFYPCSMSIEEHKMMLDRLLTVRGKVVLSGYHTPLYDSTLRRWRSIDIPTKAHLAIQGTRPDRVEVIWMDYRKDETKIC